jgi:hypothetical protein
LSPAHFSASSACYDLLLLIFLTLFLAVFLFCKLPCLTCPLSYLFCFLWIFYCLFSCLFFVLSCPSAYYLASPARFLPFPLAAQPLLLAFLSLFLAVQVYSTASSAYFLDRWPHSACSDYCAASTVLLAFLPLLDAALPLPLITVATSPARFLASSVSCAASSACFLASFTCCLASSAYYLGSPARFPASSAC